MMVINVDNYHDPDAGARQGGGVQHEKLPRSCQPLQISCLGYAGGICIQSMHSGICKSRDYDDKAGLQPEGPKDWIVGRKNFCSHPQPLREFFKLKFTEIVELYTFD